MMLCETAASLAKNEGVAPALPQLCRTARAGIVNIDAIQEVRAQFHGDYLIVLKNGQSVRLSRRYQERLLG